MLLKNTKISHIDYVGPYENLDLGKQLSARKGSDLLRTPNTNYQLMENASKILQMLGDTII